jgi:RHS repeat-associated protein
LFWKAGDLLQQNNGIFSMTTVGPAQLPPSTGSGNGTGIAAPSVTWKNTYDSMNRLTSAFVQDQPSWGGTSPVWPSTPYSQGPTLVSATSFDAFNHMTSAKFGIPLYGSAPTAVNYTRAYDNRARLLYEVDTGANATSAATNSQGTIMINGTEQGPTYPASSYAKATLTIAGSELDQQFAMCPPAQGYCYTSIPDTGTVTVNVNGAVASTTYGLGSTSAQIASSLAGAIRSISQQVVASSSGSTITIRTLTPGTAGNGLAVTASSVTTQTQYYSGPSFTVSPTSTSLSGGTNVAKSVYDTGSVGAKINGITTSVTYNSSSTPQSIAASLSAALQSADSSFLTAKTDGNVDILVSLTTGTAADYSISPSVTYDTQDFLAPSFTAYAAPAMADGTGADPNGNGLVYYYYVPQGGYAPNGNILVHSDSVMGDWYFAYDAVDRLVGAAPDTFAPTKYLNNFFCWTYDSYGNRKSEYFSTTPCSSITGSTPTNSWLTVSTANNRVTGASTLASGYVYDASGNVIADGNNYYWYDAEGQLCAEQSQRIGGASVIQYIYDPEGARIAKGTLPAAAGTPTAGGTNSLCPAAAGSSFVLTTRWLVDQTGAQATEFAESGSTETWSHSNVFAGGHLAATWDTLGIHYNLSDPLGTKRVQLNALGQIEETCTSLAFGNDVGNPASVPCALTALATADDATEHHYTGKERDTESGNDYFEARYYNSNTGRFMSPDWSAKEDPVPYANLSDPQSLNLYGYMRNNPLGGVDADGHWPDWGNVGTFVAGAINAWGSDNLAGAGRVDQTTNAGAAGARFGDAVAAVQGVAETVQGVGAAIAGGAEAFVTAPLAGTGVGIVVPGAGAVVAVAGAAEAVHGVATAGTAVTNLMKAGGNFSSGTKQGAKDAAGGKCQNCGAETTPGQKSQKGVTPPGSEGQTDHIQPKSKGGTNDPSNAQHLCRDCNRQKSDKVPNQ